MSDPSPTSPAGPSTSSRVGGRYVLRGVLGRGGMATVHRARDEVLDRDVAVKLLHAHLATDPAFLERFRREARAAAALSHPNVVAVHDWGETDEGPFLVLQLVDGPSLREVLRHRSRLHPAEAVTVLGAAAEGTGAAHQAGLVHRDVKPENLLLGLDGTVRVTDFGLARAAASATSTFGTDVLVGSPHYLSPEAVRGEPLDPRADVYALGVVLFEVLTGRPPFEADSPFATAVQHTSGRVPRPSGLVPGLPSALDEVVHRATEPDRERRYPDAAAFAAALRAAAPAEAAPLPALFAADGDAAARASGTEVLGVAEHETTVSGAVTDDAPLWPPPGAGADAVADPVGWLEDDHGGGLVHPDELDDGSDEDLDGPDDDLDDLPGPRRRRRGWLVLLVVLGLVVGSGLGGYLLWDRVFAPVTAIPAVVDAELDDARAGLEAAGFRVRVADERPHDLEVPADHVLSQDPTGEARRGATVTLVVSAGPRQVEVPRVVELPQEEAEAAITAADLVVGEVAETYSETVPAGVVVSSDPEEGDTVDEASAVDLVVSLGREPRQVPDVTGGTLEEAQAALRELGLEAEVTGREHADQPAGTVLRQDPGEGAERFRGDVVGLVLSEGPAPVEVPNLRGMLLDEAVGDAQALGLEVEVERRGGVGAFFNPGRVFDQDPGPGAELLPGDTLLLYAYED